MAAPSTVRIAPVLFGMALVAASALVLKAFWPKPPPPPYTESQKAAISAWMDRNPRDAAWIDSVRDQIVSQGMLFQFDDSQQRIYVVRGLKPSQVMSRTMWPFLKQGFVYQRIFAGIARMDLPNTNEYDQSYIEYMPGDYSANWSGGKWTGTGPYHLSDFNIIHIGRELGSEDMVISEGCDIFDKAHFRSQKMSELITELGFDPKRGNWTGDTKHLVIAVMPKVAKADKPYKWNHDSPEPWMVQLESHIASRTSTPSDKDERREYVLKGVKMSEVVRALRKPLAKYGFEADTSIYEKDEEMDEDSGFLDATFVPYEWNAEAAKIGLVAVEAVRESSTSDIRIIELYGLPVTK